MLNFLPKKFHFWFYTFFIIFLLLQSWLLLLTSILIYFLILAVYFPRRIPFTEDNTRGSGAILAPVQGLVESIEKTDDGFYRLRVTSGWINLPLLSFPVHGEVGNVIRGNTKPLLRMDSNFMEKCGNPLKDETFRGMYIEFIHAKGQEKLGIQLIGCYLGMKPRFCLLAGDKGSERSFFGHFPFGGTLVIYVPEKFRLHIDEGDKIIAGQTLIATLAN